MDQIKLFRIKRDGIVMGYMVITNNSDIHTFWFIEGFPGRWVFGHWNKLPDFHEIHKDKYLELVWEVDKSQT